MSPNEKNVVNGFCMSMHYIISAVIFLSSTSVSGTPTEQSHFVDLVDKCASLWQAKQYEKLYEYVGECGRKAPDYVPIRVLLAWREEQFGGQFEKEAADLRCLTNHANRVLCEVNPDFFSRIGEIADQADELGAICTELKHGMEYRRVNEDPRLNRSDRSFGPYLEECYMDVPFIVPDISLFEQPDHSKETLFVKTKKLARVLTKEDVARNVFDEQITYRKKKGMLDEYASEIVSIGGVQGLVEKLSDDFVRLNSYYTLDALRKGKQEAMPELKKYIEREDLSYEADEGKRMAAWALLQFAHDDPEAADYLRQLPSKIDKRHCKTLEYLKMAIKHLDDGCNRHFLEKRVGGSEDAEESKAADRETECKK